MTGESDYKSEQEAMWDAQYNLEALSDESIKIEKGCRIPVLSQIIADVPIESIEEVLDWEEIPFRLANTGEFFGLKMKDDSMSPRIESGDIVIAQINGNDACVKKFFKQEDGIILQSFTPSYAPMYFSNDKPVRIIGKVIENSQKY